MNSKLRDILEEAYRSGWLDCKEGGEHYKTEAPNNLTDLEKAIRQAVGEEMLELALPYCLTKAAERELREKIENWRMS